MVKRIHFYKALYKRFGARSLLFLLASKIKKNKLDSRYIIGLKHPVFLSNYGPDVATLFQIFLAEEYKLPFRLSPDFIVDCGANIGLSAVYYAHTFPNAKIIAIEPDKKNFNFLLKNTAPYKNVTCLNKAVWSHTTHMEMVDLGTGNWSLQTSEVVLPGSNTIEAIGISQILKDYGQQTIDILKIDIEGAEKTLFTHNYSEWLSKTKVIAIELHDSIDDAITGIFYNALKGREYKKFAVGENIICDLRQQINS